LEELALLSRQTTLHPVLNPGSMARTFFCPSGAASKSWRRFSENTLIASRGTFLHDHAHLRLHGREEESRRAVFYGHRDLIGRRRRRVDKTTLQKPQGLLFATRDGQHQ
jgi:hypothetical protein